MSTKELNAKSYIILRSFLLEEELHFIKGAILKKINLILPNELRFRTWHELTTRYESIGTLHGKLGEKRQRCLSKSEVNILMNSQLSERIYELIGDYEITDEEEYGMPEIYWRIVRTNQENDVGPIHADGWFWDINEKWAQRYKNQERIKFWIAIETEAMRNGLEIVADIDGFGGKDLLYRVVESNGKYKPMLRDNVVLPKAELLETNPGDAVMFGDRLLHAGAMNVGDKPRISIEFTCCKK